MSDAVDVSLSRLKNATARLNQLTDEAGKTLKMVEEFLGKECNTGVPVHVPIVSNPLVPKDQPGTELTGVGYDRYGDKFRLVATVRQKTETTTNNNTRHWGECDRRLKFQIVTNLPLLLDALLLQIERELHEAQSAAEIGYKLVNTLPSTSNHHPNYLAEAIRAPHVIPAPQVIPDTSALVEKLLGPKVEEVARTLEKLGGVGPNVFAAIAGKSLEEAKSKKSSTKGDK